ncbi:MAG: hypothetical protein AB1938_25430 [Myxococcota bacterium]
MTRLPLVVALVIAGAALADIAPDNLAGCRGKSAGATCQTDDGQPGVCTKTMVSRPDYSKGVPPGTKQVEMLLCVATSSAMARAPSLAPWTIGLFLTLLAGLGAWWTFRRPKPA